MLQRRVLRPTGERSNGGMEAADVGRLLSRVRGSLRTQYNIRRLTVLSLFCSWILARSMARDIDAAFSTSVVLNSTID
jgi:hypothetical protein